MSSAAVATTCAACQSGRRDAHIFASSLLLIPQVLFNAIRDRWPNSTVATSWPTPFTACESSYIYNILYIALIFFFCYFWTCIIIQSQRSCQQPQGFWHIHSRPSAGQQTANYLEKVMTRITFVGAAFLSGRHRPHPGRGVAEIDFTIASFYGGTALLIAVSVAFRSRTKDR